MHLGKRRDGGGGGGVREIDQWVKWLNEISFVCSVIADSAPGVFG